MSIPTIIAMTFMILVFSSVLIYLVYMLRKINRKTIDFKKTKGEVIKFNNVFHYFFFRRAYYPVVKYVVNNKEYEIISQAGYRLSFFKPRRLTVLYNPQNPSDAVLLNSKKLYLIIICSFSIAILLMINFIINDLLV